MEVLSQKENLVFDMLALDYFISYRTSNANRDQLKQSWIDWSLVTFL